MTYIPNFDDPRVIKRTQQALDWAETYVSKSSGNWLSQREIQRRLGSLSRPLGQFLHHQLLICVDDHFNMAAGQCKKYRLNKKGYQYLCNQLKYEGKITIAPEIVQALDTKEFVYKEQNGRAYHPLQNLPKRIKRPLLARKGFCYEYDIQCCAQTVILQQAQQLGYDKTTPCIDEYLIDREQVRQDLATQLGLSPQVIKQILHAILNGAAISSWHTSSILAYVNYNKDKISLLQSNTWIQQYKQEVRDLWKVIRSSMSIPKGHRLNAKLKSEIYRGIEGEIRKAITRSLKKEKNNHFFEHDGWTCERAIDITQLIREVKLATGYAIKLDWTIIEYVDS